MTGADEEKTDAEEVPGTESASVSPYVAEASDLPDLPDGYEYGPGIRRGLDPSYIPVARLLTSLSRFSRSLGFYNTQNRALKMVFDKLWEELEECLKQYGDLTLQADAARFYLNGEVVYEDTDREHSIPFRLFRDGIRSVTFDSGIKRSEMLELSEILGMRLTGVNRHGDDVVTRMWKADFKAIRYQEVRGFVPASAISTTAGYKTSAAAGGPGQSYEDIIRRIHKPSPPAQGPTDIGGPGTGSSETDEGVDDLEMSAPLPEDWETAIPKWMDGVYPGVSDYETEFGSTAVEVIYPDLADEETVAFLDELTVEEKNVLTRLVDYLLDLAMAEEETFKPEQLFDLVSDGRRYLLSEGLIDELADLVEFLVDVETSGEFAEVMEEMAGSLLEEFASVEVLQQVLAATPMSGEGSWQLREYLRALGRRINRDKVQELMRHGMPDVLRRVLIDCVLEALGGDRDWLRERLRAGDPLDVVSAMDALASIDEPDAREELARMIRHPKEAIRLHLLGLYEYFPYEEATQRALILALNDGSRSVRIAALEMVANRRDAKALPALQSLAEHNDFMGWNEERRDLLMRAIAAVGGAEVLPWLEGHIKIPRIWRLLSTEQRLWNEAVLPALVDIGGEGAAKILRKLKDSGPAEYRRKALKGYLSVDRQMREVLANELGRDSR
jgi:hypothetical protein